MQISKENLDFFIKVVNDSYTKLNDENNILYETLTTLNEQSKENIMCIQNLNVKLADLNKKILVQSEILEDIQTELKHDVPDEDKIENIREFIARYK